MLVFFSMLQDRASAVAMNQGLKIACTIPIQMGRNWIGFPVALRPGSRPIRPLITTMYNVAANVRKLAATR